MAIEEGREGPLRVLALLEAGSITGTAKPVLEFAYEAMIDITGKHPTQLFVANFWRGEGEPDNALIRALKAGRIPFSLIRERGRFDSAVIPQISELVRRYDVKIVWTNSVKSHFLVNRAALPKSRRWVAFHHGYTSTDLKMKLYNELDRVSLRRANRVLTVCQPLAKQMEARGVDRSRIRVQHMPIRPFTNTAEDATALREELKISSECRVILSVGRLSREKAQADLIKAFALFRERNEYSGAKLVLVGEGPERQKLEQQAKHCDVAEHVVFAGHRDDAKRFYGIANVFALSSYSEGTPNVLLEAMAAGVPIVATKVGGIPELAVDGKNALLVPAKDSDALEAALRKVLQSSALRNDLTHAAKQVVSSHSPRAYFERMREIFLEVVQE